VVFSAFLCVSASLRFVVDSDITNLFPIVFSTILVPSS
jgi:hypothetical protein